MVQTMITCRLGRWWLQVAERWAQHAKRTGRWAVENWAIATIPPWDIVAVTTC